MMSTKINTTPLKTEKALQKNIRVEELLFRGGGKSKLHGRGVVALCGSHNTIKDPHWYAVQGSDTTMMHRAS